jgi:hypothetical protein
MPAGTSPNHLWQCGDLRDGRLIAVGDSRIGRCKPADVRSSIETETDKKYPDQGYGWKPDGEPKGELRAAATHYGNVLFD